MNRHDKYLKFLKSKKGPKEMTLRDCVKYCVYCGNSKVVDAPYCCHCGFVFNIVRAAALGVFDIDYGRWQEILASRQQKKRQVRTACKQQGKNQYHYTIMPADLGLPATIDATGSDNPNWRKNLFPK